MVLLFADRKSREENEIAEILKHYNTKHISDKEICWGSAFSVITLHKSVEIKAKKGIAVFCNDTERFKNQILPQGFIGICEDNNKSALNILKINNIPVISCGMNSKNTITLSSINSNTLVTGLQRTVFDLNYNEILPTELKIKLKENYKPFSVMVSVGILLLNGIIPDEF
ncbi:MAG: hypothetical protein IKT93_01810 [Clostridia bacterium]|nr:hypothetical protein [Clostridia bacterium]